MKQPLPLTLTLCLAVAVAASAVALVYTKHEARKLFNRLTELSRERDELNIEWGQLQIEQSTFATHSRVERVATEELALVRPDPERIQVIRSE